MPELPEVETVRRQIAPFLKGKQITAIHDVHPKTIKFSPDLPQRMIGWTFGDIDRVAKLLLINFEETDTTLCVHLKMTGQLVWRKGEELAGGGHSLRVQKFDMPHNHTRATFDLHDGSHLFYNDLRLFGYLKLTNPEETEVIRQSYGIEPLTESFTREAFEEIFQRHKQTNIKALLLNQQRIAGLGNIYVDEVCFMIGISPKRRVGKITKQERDALYDACQQIIAHAIDAGGTTFQYFNLADGKKGDFRDHLQVFAQQGKPCPQCGTTIEKEQWAGRGTHFCPKCQR